MKPQKNIRLEFIIFSFLIVLCAFTHQQNNFNTSLIAAEVVAIYPNLNANITAFLISTNGECYKLAGYLSLLSDSEQEFLVGRANYTNDRCFQRPVSQEDIDEQKLAFSQITTDLSLTATADASNFKSALAAYQAIQLKYSSSDDTSNVSTATSSISAYVKVNKCLSRALKLIRDFEISRRHIVYSTLTNLDAVCQLKVVTNDTLGSVYTNCKMSLGKAKKLLSIYQDLAPCLMGLNNEFAIAVNSARATISNLSQCKIARDEPSSTESTTTDAVQVFMNLTNFTSNSSFSSNISSNTTPISKEHSKEDSKAKKRSESCKSTVNVGSTRRILQQGPGSQGGSYPGGQGSNQGGQGGNQGGQGNTPGGQGSPKPAPKNSTMKNGDNPTMTKSTNPGNEQPQEKQDITQKPNNNTNSQNQNRPQKNNSSNNEFLVETSTKSTASSTQKGKDQQSNKPPEKEKSKPEDSIPSLKSILVKSTAKLETLNSIVSDYSVCQSSKATFNSKGHFVVPIQQTSLDKFTSQISNLSAAFNTSDANNFQEFIDSVLDPNSGYNPSCSPIAQIIKNNFDVKGGFLANVNGKINSMKGGPNFWFLCQYNNSTTSLDYSCKEGDCSPIYSGSGSSPLSINAWITNFNSLHISVWRVNGITSYFAEYSTSSTSDSSFSQKNFEYQVGKSKSNQGVCQQIVGCMHDSVSSGNSTSVCFEKMKPKCEEALNAVNAISNLSSLLSAFFVTNDIPYLTLEAPNANFLRFLANFLITDGFNHGKAIYLGFSLALASNDTNSTDSTGSTASSLRILDSSEYDDRLDSDPNAQISSSSYDDSEVNCDGSTSQQAASESRVETSINNAAIGYNNGESATNNWNTYSTSRFINKYLIYPYILLISLLIFS